MNRTRSNQRRKSAFESFSYDTRVMRHCDTAILKPEWNERDTSGAGCRGQDTPAIRR